MNSALENLRRDFGGDIIEPGAAEYESASRSVLTLGSPAFVLRPENVGDVQALVAAWGQTGSGLAADLNGDGVVNVADLQLLVTNWTRYLQ